MGGQIGDYEAGGYRAQSGRRGLCHRQCRWERRR
jgi:hypothetical protein